MQNPALISDYKYQILIETDSKNDGPVYVVLTQCKRELEVLAHWGAMLMLAERGFLKLFLKVYHDVDLNGEPVSLLLQRKLRTQNFPLFNSSKVEK